MKLECAPLLPDSHPRTASRIEEGDSGHGLCVSLYRTVTWCRGGEQMGVAPAKALDQFHMPVLKVGVGVRAS